jgi:hypothetical protein
MRSRALALAATLLVGAAAPAIARAQSAGELVAARALFAEGTELEKKKDYTAALEKFRKVASIKSTAIVRYHEGFCAERLGRWIEALDAYARAVIDGQGDPKHKDAVDAARKAEASLRPRVPKIHTKVQGTQKGKYEVRIDGAPVSAALLDTAVPVDVGKHVVEISGDNIAPDSQEITVAEKETKEVVFHTKDPSTVPPPKDDPKKPKKDPEPPPPIEKPIEKPIEPPATTKPLAPKFSIVFGLSFGNISPAGKIVDTETTNLPAFARERDGAKTSDQAEYFGWGMQIEPLIGVRVMRPVAVYVFGQWGSLSKSGFSKESSDFSASTRAFGLGVMLNTHPNGPIGGYVDLAISSRTTIYDNVSFNESATLSGSNFRFKVGAAYKVTPTITALGFGFLALGSYTSFDYANAAGPVSEDVDKTATHTFLGVGLGATYDLALGKN